MDEITSKVLDIIRRVKQDTSPSLKPENFSQPLTGKIFRMNARQLTYVALEVMYEFGIRLDPEDVLEYHFNTIHEIIQTVRHKKSELSA